ncbi:MAG: EI24 domain-containing protein, partial [Curvibacter sp.]|nr:EI24 domain-containing protein [Curvibacter sp.]
MGRVVDAFWRAAAYCLHPRVIALSLAPLLTSAALAFALGWFFWEPAVGAVRATLDSWQLIDTLLHYLSFIGADGFRAALAPIVVLVLAVPLVVIMSLLLVALLMSPALVRLVAARRFAKLERRRGAAWWRSLFWSLGHGVLALILLVLSMPLWLIPPLVLIIPPLIWGWLGYRVFAYDVLAEHATIE